MILGNVYILLYILGVSLRSSNFDYQIEVLLNHIFNSTQTAYWFNHTLMNVIIIDHYGIVKVNGVEPNQRVSVSHIIPT